MLRSKAAKHHSRHFRKSRENKRQVVNRALTSFSKYCPHTPTPKQQQFLDLDCLEALYGGAAGGGKSDALLMGALQYVHVPGYAAIIFRRTFADLSLPGALIPRAEEWLAGTDSRWNEQKKTWTFPSGATITFGYLDKPKDKFRYQSSEFQYIAFDELTHFRETDYRYLFSRLRKPEGMPVPLRMRSGTNPPETPDGKWVYQRLIVEGKKHGRVFIPSKLEDNPHVDHESYIESLGELDEVTRMRLRDGIWEILVEGNFFKRSYFKIITKAEFEKLRRDSLLRNVWRFVRYWDMAATEEGPANKDPDWTVGALVGFLKGQYFIVDVVRFRGSPVENERIIHATATKDGIGIPIFIEQEGGASGKSLISHYARNVLFGFVFSGDTVRDDKLLRAKPLSAAAANGNVILVEGDWIGEFLDELVAFPNSGHDDQVDASSGAHRHLSKGAKVGSC